jgi:small-conductance mechanosensitive channel
MRLSKEARMSWERAAVVAGVIAVTAVVARIADRRIARSELDPQAVTRYRVVRRTVSATIVIVGVLSALLAIPAIRAVAGGILASSAVIGLVVGFAAQRTLSNFVAGILIAFTQPVRIGDRVEVGGQAGVVEEIGLTYTFIRLDDRSRLVIPNDKLASDTIRNSTIVSPEKVAEITVHVPLSQDLGAVVELLRGETSGEVFVSALNGDATVTVRGDAPDEAGAERVEQDLRLRVHARLREAGIWRES